MNNKILTIIINSVLLIVLVGIGIGATITNYWFYTIISIIGIYLISYKLKIPKFAVLLFAVSFIVRMLVIIIFQPPIESDFAVLYEMSKSLLNKDMSYTETGYLLSWGYQIGFIFFQTILLKICDSVFFLKIVNCIFAAGINTLLYLILKEFVNEKAAKFTSLLFMVYLHPMFLTTVLTNQHSSAFFIVLGLYIMVSSKLDNKINTYLRYAIVATLIAIGNILRPEGIVFIFSIILFLIIGIKKGNIKKIITSILIILITYYAIMNVASVAFKATGLSKNGLENTNPLWKFVLGFNYETRGAYSEEDCQYINDKEKELEVILDRTIRTSPLEILGLFKDKAIVFWTGTGLYWSINYLSDENVNIFGRECNGIIVSRLLLNYNSQIYTVAFWLSVLGAAALLLRRNYKNNKVTLFGIITLVYFGVYLLIEIQNRYTYLPRVILFVLVGIGVETLVEFIKKKFKCEEL